MRNGLLLVAVCGALACADEPRCGDGHVDDGEDELTCCADVGCGSGVCDTGAMECVDPWMLSCPEQTGECSADQPYVCDGDLPSYDCTNCGCPSGQTCFNWVCINDGAVALQREGPMIPDDLPIDDYFSFIDRNSAVDAMTYPEFVAALDSRLREDRRINSLLIGETHGSADEQAVALSLIRDLNGLGWKVPEIGIEGETPIIDVEPLLDIGTLGHNFEGDLTNDAHCFDLESRVANRLNDESLYIQYSGSGHTTQEICYHPMHWGICDLPHTSECVTRVGRKAATVMLFDPDIWLWQIDRTLLWRLPAISDRTGFEAGLENNRRRWEQSMANQPLEGFDAMVGDVPVNVRMIPAEHADDVYIAYFPRPARQPWLHETYRTIWHEPGLQDFLVANEMSPGHCSISWNLTPGEETLWVWCSNDQGFELNATVDGKNWEIKESSTTGPGSATSLRDLIPWDKVQGTTGTMERLGY